MHNLAGSLHGGSGNAATRGQQRWQRQSDAMQQEVETNVLVKHKNQPNIVGTMRCIDKTQRKRRAMTKSTWRDNGMHCGGKTHHNGEETQRNRTLWWGAMQLDDAAGHDNKMQCEDASIKQIKPAWWEVTQETWRRAETWRDAAFFDSVLYDIICISKDKDQRQQQLWDCMRRDVGTRMHLHRHQQLYYRIGRGLRTTGV